MATYDLATQSAPSIISTNDIINCSYCGTYKSITLPAGQYKLECWGAQGGANVTTGTLSTRYGGYGGYTYGIVALIEPTILYLYTGGQPTSTAGGWNGGGNGYSNGAGGGGASDIRIGSTSLSYRVIVAGGGGGCGNNHTSTSIIEYGGAGGGTTGGRGYCSSYGDTTTAYYGYGGTQSAVGTSAASGSSITTGGLGQGSSCSTNYGTGGGGGWYGGGAGQYESAGGGSSFAYTASIANCSLNSKYYLSTTGMQQGVRTGHGLITITAISVGGIKVFLKTASSTWKQIN